MIPRERVLAALRGDEPDQVPYCEFGIDRALAQRLMGWAGQPGQAADLERNPFSLPETLQIAERLRLDNISYVLRAPVYARKAAGQDGRLFYCEGLIRTEADLPRLQLPDPHDEALYAGAAALARRKGDYAACLVTRLGLFPTMLSMGIENFGLALFDNRDLVEAVLDRYCDWAAPVAERAGRLGFDVFVSTDDMAFKSGPFLSPGVFREVVWPRYRRIAEKLTIPWVVHSDGNVLPLLDDLLELGIAGLHPVEKGAMDIRDLKRRYGRRLCLLGNVDLDILARGTTDQVEQEVRALIRDVGPGGAYIVTSGNSLAGYVQPDNALALSRSVQKYGRYPLSRA
jgi:hypothetical protein